MHQLIRFLATCGVALLSVGLSQPHWLDDDGVVREYGYQFPASWGIVAGAVLTVGWLWLGYRSRRWVLAAIVFGALAAVRAFLPNWAMFLEGLEFFFGGGTVDLGWSPWLMFGGGGCLLAAGVLGDKEFAAWGGPTSLPGPRGPAVAAWRGWLVATALTVAAVGWAVALFLPYARLGDGQIILGYHEPGVLFAAVLAGVVVCLAWTMRVPYLWLVGPLFLLPATLLYTSRGYLSPLDPDPPFNLFGYRLAAAATALAAGAAVVALAEISRLRTELNRHLAAPGSVGGVPTGLWPPEVGGVGGVLPGPPPAPGGNWPPAPGGNWPPAVPGSVGVRPPAPAPGSAVVRPSAWPGIPGSGGSIPGSGGSIPGQPSTRRAPRDGGHQW